MNKALDVGRTPLRKKSRWLLLKREESLKEEQRFRLRDLLRYNLKTVRAYLLKEAFQPLWNYSSPVWAGKFLDEWCRQTMRFRIEPRVNPRIFLRNRNFRRLAGGPSGEAAAYPCLAANSAHRV
jgi:transposase